MRFLAKEFSAFVSLNSKSLSCCLILPSNALANYVNNTYQVAEKVILMIDYNLFP